MVLGSARSFLVAGLIIRPTFVTGYMEAQSSPQQVPLDDQLSKSGQDQCAVLQAMQQHQMQTLARLKSGPVTGRLILHYQ
jgi:hypothetical protein